MAVNENPLENQEFTLTPIILVIGDNCRRYIL